MRGGHPRGDGFSGIVSRRWGLLGSRAQAPGDVGRCRLACGRCRGLRASRRRFWVWLRARWAVAAAGHGPDLAIDADGLVDRLPEVLGVVGPAEGPRQPRGGEREGQDVVLEVADLGVGFHQCPGAAFDLGERLQDLGPGAAQNLHVGSGAGGRPVSRAGNSGRRPAGLGRLGTRRDGGCGGRCRRGGRCGRGRCVSGLSSRWRSL